MRILPIPFTGSMVRAILREIEQPGTGKTMTRRVLNPQPFLDGYYEGEIDCNFVPATACNMASYVRFSATAVGGGAIRTEAHELRYDVGDRLYAREAWRCDARLNKKAPREIATNYPGIKYVATAEPDDFGIEGKFRQGMHMPKWASRITLIVTSVRVERLQDISEEDAVAEGVERIDSCDIYHVDHSHHAGSASATFSALWDSLNAKREGGKYAWAKNPWVSVTSFRPILGNIDQIAEAA